MEDKRSYYAIIPANVRYDKELPSSAKLLYGEITALSGQEGFCWAKNSYFAELYGTAESTIKRWISLLEERGYLRRNIEYEEDGKTVIRRCLSIVPNEPTSVQKRDEGRFKNETTPGLKNETDNNTSMNNTNEYINSINRVEGVGSSKVFKKPTVSEIKAYCEERNNNVDAETFWDFYESKGWKIGNQAMKDWKAAVRTWERSRQFSNKATSTTEYPED